MVFRERTYSVLLVSASGSFLTSLQPMLPMSEYWPVTTVTSISSARRALVEKTYDLIIINTPLRDEFGTRFAIDVSAKSSAIVLLFVKNDRYPEVYGKVMEHGVLAVSKPTSTQMVAQSLRVMCTMRERLRMMEAKQATVEDKIAEIRLFNRAKWLLRGGCPASVGEAGHGQPGLQEKSGRGDHQNLCVSVWNGRFRRRYL